MRFHLACLNEPLDHSANAPTHPLRNLLEARVAVVDNLVRFDPGPGRDFDDQRLSEL